MGAINFIKTGYGINPGEVFESIVKKAEYEYGHDRYNGTISGCALREIHKYVFYGWASK